MVKKLLKHEFVYYFRTFGMFLPIVLAIAAVTRVFLLFESADNVIGNVAIVSSIILLIIACFALVILSVAASVIRFYKNMYSAEGYLTFTLPVTNREHIFVKLLTALSCQAVCVATAIVAAVIAASGEPLKELASELGEALSMFFTVYGTGNAVAYILEALIMLLLSAVSNTLLFYTCTTVGQIAKKNRILMAFCAYFIYYVATQMLSTVLAIAVMLLESAGVLDAVEAWLETNSAVAIHIYLIGAIVIGTALTALYWFVTERIMTIKLNLE